MDLIDLFLHLDEHLASLVEQFGWGSYVVLFAIVFCETGLVFTPFLPGDSLIFVAATLAAQEVMNVLLLWPLLLVAAIVGDSVNYWIGSRFGRKLVREKGLIRHEHLDRTRAFYEKYGKKTIVIARFIPIVRTFAPFMAGMAHMDYKVFWFYNVLGGFLWVTLFTFAGYFFGELPWVQENLHYLILLIIFLSLLPPVWEYWRNRKAVRSEK
ncbi:MAG: DedA family protein [Patescibacteria group bacterium]